MAQLEQTVLYSVVQFDDMYWFAPHVEHGVQLVLELPWQMPVKYVDPTTHWLLSVHGRQTGDVVGEQVPER